MADSKIVNQKVQELRIRAPPAKVAGSEDEEDSHWKTPGELRADFLDKQPGISPAVKFFLNHSTPLYSMIELGFRIHETLCCRRRVNYRQFIDGLDTGDIMICSTQTTELKCLECSEWCHVLVLVKDPPKEFITSNPDDEPTNGLYVYETELEVWDGRPKGGAQLVPLASWLRRDDIGGYCAVRKLKNFERTPERLNMLWDIMREWSTKPFWEDISFGLKMVHRFPGLKTVDRDMSGLFCSQMVAEIYNRWGLLDGDLPRWSVNAYSPQHFGPRGFNKCDIACPLCICCCCKPIYFDINKRLLLGAQLDKPKYLHTLYHGAHWSAEVIGHKLGLDPKVLRIPKRAAKLNQLKSPVSTARGMEGVTISKDTSFYASDVGGPKIESLEVSDVSSSDMKTRETFWVSAITLFLGVMCFLWLFKYGGHAGLLIQGYVHLPALLVAGVVALSQMGTDWFFDHVIIRTTSPFLMWERKLNPAIAYRALTHQERHGWELDTPEGHPVPPPRRPFARGQLRRDAMQFLFWFMSYAVSGLFTVAVWMMFQVPQLLKNHLSQCTIDLPHSSAGDRVLSGIASLSSWTGLNPCGSLHLGALFGLMMFGVSAVPVLLHNRHQFNTSGQYWVMDLLRSLCMSVVSGVVVACAL